jgi:predicted  nucleic acid-binding Zn-ribbon protein
LKEIENLQRALPDMKMLSSLEPELKKIRDEKKKIQLDLDVVKKFIDEKEDKISDVKNASQA